MLPYLLLLLLCTTVADLASFLSLRAAEFVPGGLLALTLIGSGGDDDFDAHAYLR
jgi:hypothetical protein